MGALHKGNHYGSAGLPQQLFPAHVGRLQIKGMGRNRHRRSVAGPESVAGALYPFLRGGGAVVKEGRQRPVFHDIPGRGRHTLGVKGRLEEVFRIERIIDNRHQVGGNLLPCLAGEDGHPILGLLGREGGLEDFQHRRHLAGIKDNRVLAALDRRRANLGYRLLHRPFGEGLDILVGPAGFRSAGVVVVFLAGLVGRDNVHRRDGHCPAAFKIEAPGIGDCRFRRNIRHRSHQPLLDPRVSSAGIPFRFQQGRLLGSGIVFRHCCRGKLPVTAAGVDILLDAFLRYFSRFQRPFKQLGDFLPGKGFGRGNAGPAVYNNPQADPFNRRTGQAVDRFPQDAHLTGIVCLIIQLIIGNILFRRVSRGFFAER